jgi:hypothetical protein
MSLPKGSSLKDELQHVFDMLKGIEDRARKLKNQNLADIAASAHGKVKQLVDHPDAELVAEGKAEAAPTTQADAIKHVRAEGDADPEATARHRWPHLFDPPPAPLPQQPTYSRPDERRDDRQQF